MVWRIWQPQQEQGEKATSVPMRQGGVEPCWFEHSQPADLEGRTKVGKIHRGCWEKMALSQCLSFLTILTTNSDAPLGYSYFKACSKWAVVLLDQGS